jgi:Uma2 family endonuclease
MPRRASAPPSKRKRRLTEAEFLRLPDDGRKYELVDGETKEVPSGHEHDVIGMRLGARILGCASSRRGYVAGSQAGFRMVNGNIRSPDVAFTLKERLPGGKPSKGFEDGAPDLAVEIVSPNEDAADLLRKVGEYFASGAQQVWLLFPETRTVNLYTSPFTVRTLQADDELTGGDLLPDFRCTVRELFEMG